MSDHLVEFTIAGRGRDGSSNWTSQGDQTTHWAELELVGFKYTKHVILYVLHIMINMEGDLFGTRAADKRVTMISSRSLTSRVTLRIQLPATSLVFYLRLIYGEERSAKEMPYEVG